MSKNLTVLTLVALCLCGSGQAQNAAATLDPAKTHVSWILSGNVHDTHGTFHVKEGKISLNLSTKMMTGAVVVDAKSGESGNSQRDHRMHSEIIESAKYPEIRFTPSNWQGDVTTEGTSKIQVTGVMEMHGGKHPVTVPMEVKVGQGRFTATGQFDVPYVEWGIKDPSTFLFKVGKKVAIHIDAEGELAR